MSMLPRLKIHTFSPCEIYKGSLLSSKLSELRKLQFDSSTNQSKFPKSVLYNFQIALYEFRTHYKTSDQELIA